MSLPKTVFFFWENVKLSWLRYMTLYSFRKLHPDWKMQLYVSTGATLKKTWRERNEQDFFAYRGKDYFHKVEALDIEIVEWSVAEEELDGVALTPPHKSDLFQWRRLNEGGVYCDMDVLWVRSIDSWLEAVRGCDVVFPYFNDHFTIGFLVSAGRNCFWEQLAKRALELYTSSWYEDERGASSYQSMGSGAVYYTLDVPLRDVHVRRQYMQTARQSKKDYWKILEFLFKRIRFCNVAKEFVYPWDHTELKSIFLQKCRLPEETHGIHWYGGSKIAQQFNNFANPVSVKRQRCTLSAELLKLL